MKKATIVFLTLLFMVHIALADTNIVVTPGDESLPEAEIIRIAKAALLDAYDLDPAYFDGGTVNADYEIPSSSTIGTPIWIVSMGRRGGYVAEYQVCLLPDGTITRYPGILGTPWEEAEKREEEERPIREQNAKIERLEQVYGPRHTWSLEIKNLAEPFNHLLPSENDITPEDAIEIATKALVEKFSIEKEELEQYEVYLSLVHYGMVDSKRKNSYFVEFGTPDNVVSVYGAILLSDDGEIMDIWGPDLPQKSNG